MGNGAERLPLYMKVENELGMIVAFFLSKFGETSLSRLGFHSYKHAFEETGRTLGVNPNSVKNWRDEFDPYYDNGRKGWYQREIRQSRLKVISTFDGLSEDALLAVILDIIQPNQRPKIETDLHSVLKEIKDADKEKAPTKKVEYSPRGPTGKMAEEFFVSQFQAGLTPFDGVLQDCRDNGVGYDFEIRNKQNLSFVEIKGSSKEFSGITFTDKEWKIAKEKRDVYFLGLVTEIPLSPKIRFLKNPSNSLVPVYRAYTTIAVSWSVNAEQVRNQIGN